MEDRYCPVPFQIFHVTPGGDINLGCGVVLPENVGNISTTDVEGIWNGDKVLRIRDAVLDGSFRYCDHIRCQRLIACENVLPRKSAPEADMVEAVRDGKRRVDTIPHLWLEYDPSCNLSCPSCRTKVLAARSI